MIHVIFPTKLCAVMVGFFLNTLKTGEIVNKVNIWC